MFRTIAALIYAMAMHGMALFACQALVLVLLFLAYRRRTVEPPPVPKVWPPLTVQLPIFNEQFVVERLINAVCALDYPRAALSIQVLDDSTDATTEIVRRQVEMHRKQGIQIRLLHRTERIGYKAGALAAGLCSAPGELIALFDADFVPRPDFLKCLVPYLVADPRLGMVQARWEHLNADYSPLTRGQALSIDGYFVTVQTARSRSGLLFNFNGSAGVWRRQCIAEAGGWQGDTLTEDLDLSYRAQLCGWRLAYVPEVGVPAEIPAQLAAYKAQQYRWARGGIEVLLKLGGQIWRAPLSIPQRMAGWAHLAAHLVHPFMLLYLLACLPLVLVNEAYVPSLPWLVPAGLGPPLLLIMAQSSIYPDWKQRIAYFPVPLCLGIGLALSNTVAVLAAFSRRSATFARTPKFHLETEEDTWQDKSYVLPMDWTILGELALAIYAAWAMLLAAEQGLSLALALGLYALGFGLVGGVGLYQDWGRRGRKR